MLLQPPLLLAMRAPQIWTNFKNGHTGQVSWLSYACVHFFCLQVGLIKESSYACALDACTSLCLRFPRIRAHPHHHHHHHHRTLLHPPPLCIHTPPRRRQQLALITVVMSVGGTAIRVFTTVNKHGTADPQLINHGFAFLLNLVVLLQVRPSVCWDGMGWWTGLEEA